ncbi:unnamed protein product [Scytosiphon promiscuus]
MLGPRNAMKLLSAVAALCCARGASASSSGGGGGGPLNGFRSALMTQQQQQQQRLNSNNMNNRRKASVGRACSPVEQGRRHGVMAAAIPGDSFAGEVVVGGLLNFLSIYNILITGRVLLSWVPQLQGVQALQPVYLLTDPYLNAFRRLNLTIGGLDLSVLPAFFLLSFATNAVASLGAEMPAPAKRGASWLNGRRAAISRSRRNLAAFSSAAISGDSGSSRSSAQASSTPATATPAAASSQTRRPFFAFRA